MSRTHPHTLFVLVHVTHPPHLSHPSLSKRILSPSNVPCAPHFRTECAVCAPFSRKMCHVLRHMSTDTQDPPHSPHLSPRLARRSPTSRLGSRRPKRPSHQLRRRRRRSCRRKKKKSLRACFARQKSIHPPNPDPISPPITRRRWHWDFRRGCRCA